MSAQIFYNNGSSSSEVITHLINSTDGTGLHFDGAAGNIDIPTVPDLGTKFSFEFIAQKDNTAESYLVDFYTGGRFIVGQESGDANLKIYDNTSWKTFGVAPLDDLKVHHLVVTIDGTAAILYDNGNQVGTVTIGSSHAIDSCTDAMFPSTVFAGTFYRTRFWNKTLSQAEVTASYENATVPFADQYGSQTNLVTGIDSTLGTDVANKTAFNAAYGWQSYAEAVVSSNVLTLTAASAGLGIYKQVYKSGQNVRLTLNVTAITGTWQFRPSTGGDATDITTTGIKYLTALQTDDYVRFYSEGAATISIDASSTNLELVTTGCVSDYDLAFANPTQSNHIQDRAGNADGTKKPDAAGGVVQVTPIEQLNSKAISVSNATQRTPANGDIVADKVGVAIVPTAPLHVYHNTTGEYAAIIDQDEPNAGHGLKVTSDGNGAGSILFDVESVSTSLLRVLGNGNVGIGCSPSYPLEVQSGGVGTVLRAGTSFVSIDSTGSAAAPSLILNGDADTGLWHPSANTLAIATAGTDRLTIDSGGDVLVGTGSANLIAGERALTVGAGTTGDVVGSVELQGSRTTDAYFGAFSMFHKANRVAEIRGNRDGADDAAALTFHTKATGVANAIERLRISSAGLATFANGIAFSNQTDASGTGITSGATTLQHYETGEWTPKYTSTGATWTTYYEQVGRYTRIGNMVSYSGRLRVNAAPTGTVSNSAIIDGLPFTSLNVIGTEASVTVGLQTFATTLSPAVTYGGTFITPYKSNTTSIIIASETTAAFFMFSGHYIAQ